MNANAIVNRAQIFFYSILISAMSGINNIRAHLQHTVPVQPQVVSDGSAEMSQVLVRPDTRSLASSWNSIMEAFLLLLLWTVLGFSAGFLIGMISPR